MPCRMFKEKLLAEPMLMYCQWDPKEQTQWILYRNSGILANKNAFENVIFKMVVILSRPQCVKSINPWEFNVTDLPARTHMVIRRSTVSFTTI